MVFGFFWLAEKMNIIKKQGIRLIVVKGEIVEILYFIFGTNLMDNANNRFCCKTDGIKSARGDFISYFVVIGWNRIYYSVSSLHL